ncbi:MAG: hypothetical protein J6B02_01535 [Selenomonadales bacterium]|nr:hypothetical protein [Selenomonadales bacterium]
MEEERALGRLKALWLGLCMAMAVCLSLQPMAEASPAVERIEAVIAADGEVQLADPVVRRMQASVITVGDSLLMGKDVSAIEAHRAEYEGIIRDVFDRILVGYSVETASLRAGETTCITVRVSPWGDTIRSVRVETDFAGLSPSVADFVRSHVGSYEKTIESILLGLSVDSIDWATSVAKRTVNEQMAEDLPEFKAGFEVTGGRDTVIRLTFLPQGDIVKTVAVDLESTTIPHLVLWELRPKLETIAGDLVGLPVSYVARHQQFLCEEAVREVERKYPFIKKHGIVIVPTMNVGTKTDINLRVETTKYRIALESYLEMDKDDNNAKFKLHAGRYINARQEAFLDVEFSPGDIRWEFLPGWSYHANEKTWLGIKYNLNRGDEWLFLEEAVGKRWKLRAELCPRSGESEIGLRYRLYDLFSLEYVIREGDKWIRLIGNL